MDRDFVIEKIGPLLIVFVLWLDGWFYPLVLLPLLYVPFVEKKRIALIGFKKSKSLHSILLGLCFAVALSFAVVYPIFEYYGSLMPPATITAYVLFTDMVWYPFYEEIAYRGFALGHAVPVEEKNEPDRPTSNQSRLLLSRRSTLANLGQSLFFLSVHYRNVAEATPLKLIPVFILGFVNGLIFLRTRNIAGCFVAHSMANGLALMI